MAPGRGERRRAHRGPSQGSEMSENKENNSTCFNSYFREKNSLGKVRGGRLETLEIRE